MAPVLISSYLPPFPPEPCEGQACFDTLSLFALPTSVWVGLWAIGPLGLLVLAARDFGVRSATRRRNDLTRAEVGAAVFGAVAAVAVISWCVFSILASGQPVAVLYGELDTPTRIEERR